MKATDGVLVCDSRTRSGQHLDSLPDGDVDGFLDAHVLDRHLLIAFPENRLAEAYAWVCSFLARKDRPSLAVFALPVADLLVREGKLPGWPPALPDLAKFIEQGGSVPLAANRYQGIVTMLWLIMEKSVENPDDHTTVFRAAGHFERYMGAYAAPHSPVQVPEPAPAFADCAPVFRKYVAEVAPVVPVELTPFTRATPFTPVGIIPASEAVSVGIVRTSAKAGILVLPVRSLRLSAEQESLVIDLGRAVLKCWGTPPGAAKSGGAPDRPAAAEGGTGVPSPVTAAAARTPKPKRPAGKEADEGFEEFDPDVHIALEEAAKLLGISTKTIARREKDGVLRRASAPGRRPPHFNFVEIERLVEHDKRLGKESWQLSQEQESRFNALEPTIVRIGQAKFAGLGNAHDQDDALAQLRGAVCVCIRRHEQIDHPEALINKLATSVFARMLRARSRQRSERQAAEDKAGTPRHPQVT